MTTTSARDKGRGMPYSNRAPLVRFEAPQYVLT